MISRTFSTYQERVGVTGMCCWRRYIDSHGGPRVASTSLVPTRSVTASGWHATMSSRRWSTFQARLPLIPAFTNS